MANEKKPTPTPTNNDVAEFWKKTFDEQLNRIEAVYAQWETVDKAGLEHVYGSIDQMADLWKSSIDYSLQLSVQSRDVFVDSIKQVREHVATTR